MSLPQAAIAAPTDLRGKRILLAEDEFVIAFGLQTELEELGAFVAVVDSVADGLPVAANGWDACILDVRLADGDVYPLADQLQRLGVPIVFHSAHADVTSLTGRYPGAAALRKPCWGSVLAGSIARCLHGPVPA